jgi:iron complex outermembrane receptor protein
MTKFRLLVAAISAFAPAYAFTQAVSASDAATPATIQEIIVTAQKRSEKLNDVPITITALTGAQLSSSGIEDTRSLGQVVPGLSFAADGAWAQPSLNGITTSNTGAGEESPIAIYVDGVYQVSEIASLFQLPDVAQIEVLKGPQGTLSGRNAEGGAIQISTKEPSFTPTVDVTASMGYYTGEGQSRTSGDPSIKGFVSGPLISDVLAGSFSFAQDYVDGYLENVGTNTRDGLMASGIFRAKLLYTPTDGVRLLFSTWYTDSRDHVATNFTVYDGLSAANFYPGSVLGTQPWTVAHDFPSFVDTTSSGGSLRATVNFDAGTLTSLTSYSHVSNDLRIQVTGSSNANAASRASCYLNFSCVDYAVSQPAISESQEFDWASRLYGPFSYVAGLYQFRSDEHQGSSINTLYLPGAVDDIDRVVTTSYAAFAEANYKFTDRLTGILGGRYSYEKKDGSYEASVPGPYVTTAQPDWTSFTPRASLSDRVDDLSNVYFTYSQGFKSGVINVSAPFTVVKPETLTSYEVGFKRNAPLYSIDASAFYYRYKDIQIQQLIGIDFLTTNAARGTITGLDIDGSVLITPDLRLRLAATYLPIARYDQYTGVISNGLPIGISGFPQVTSSASGDRLMKAPILTSTLSAEYKKDLPWGSLQVNASVYHSDSYFWQLNYRVETGAYNVVNSNISFTPTGSRITYSVWGRNLTGAAYLDGFVSGNTFSDAAVYAPPREIGVSVGYKY